MARNELWAAGVDESVEVNQRALINKILARYSAEFTVFRELLQNSDDAGSSEVEIRFETQTTASTGSHGGTDPFGETTLPDLKTAPVSRWIFKNNGRAFGEEDWNRLKKIAEGNPDEDKIGAFGVGFYSVFSVTDTPFVTSGSQWMGFYWKDNKDQLFARRGALPSDSSWTTFELTLREPCSMPPAFDLTRFLSSSIVFMTHLANVSIYFNTKCLTRLTKSSTIPRELSVPKDFQTLSPKKLMRIKRVKLTDAQITAAVLQWVYSTWTEKPHLAAESSGFKSKAGGFISSLFSALSKRPTETPVDSSPEISDPLSVNVTNLTLSIFSADVEVQVDQKLAKALHRSTLKAPPSKLRYELIYTPKDEYDKALKEDEKYANKTMSIFHGLRADVEGSGLARIYIGHATAQATGFAGHMAARFIPTVERESIDLMDPNVAIWNRELLFVGGFLARSAYEQEIRNVDETWHDSNAAQADSEARLRHRALHAIKFFTFYKSTPSEEVSATFEKYFFSCGPQRIPIISTRGVQNARDVRYPDAATSGFIKHVPVLATDVAQDAHRMVSTLRNRGLIKDISFEDVIVELGSRPLQEDEMLACLQWWFQVAKMHSRSEAEIGSLLQSFFATAVMTRGENNAILVQLGKIRTFINPTGPSSQIPPDGPLPDHLFPITLGKRLAPMDMTKCLLWTELTILEWVKHICSPLVLASETSFNIDVSARWAERVLQVLARVWSNLPTPMKEGIGFLLAERTCIPTSRGMSKPASAYFGSADIFHDLPVVALSSGQVKGQIERLLEALGVQKHIDLQTIFSRMVKTREWTTADLISYLVSIRQTLSAEEVARLKATPAFFKEEAKPSSTDEKIQRFQAGQLYEPIETLRKMGLPIIDWGKQKKWRSSSKEANFLFELGLQRHPPLNNLVLLCASSVPEVRQVAFRYLLDNIDKLYTGFLASDYDDLTFIPAIRNNTPCLGSPKDVFVESEWTPMGFLVLDTAYRQEALRLGISSRPPVPQLVDFLETNRPGNKAEAQVWFELLASRIGELTQADRTRLAGISMVPHTNVENSLIWLSPPQCYLSNENLAEHLSKLFYFVNFGVTANSFLAICGAKRLPTMDEIAQKLLHDPGVFLAIAGGHENFLAELRQMGINIHQLSRTTLEGLQSTPCLLAAQRKHRKKHDADVNDPEDSAWEVVYHFKIPNEIIIVDDTQSFRVFGESLFTAPQEDILEEFYHKLGARRLSSLVKEDYGHGAEVNASSLSTKIQSLILERVPLFLHERNASQVKLSPQWLASDGKIVVKTYHGLYITKSLIAATLRLSQKQDASAVVYQSKNGVVCLWLSTTLELDMYEVAMGLNRLLLEKPTANDTLLLMTILSTELGLLKKRGFDVERILRRRAAESVTKVEPSLRPSAADQARPNDTISTNLRPLIGTQPTSTRHTGHESRGEPPAAKPHHSRSVAALNRTNIMALGKTIESAIRACHSESDPKFDVLQSVRENLKREFHDSCGITNTLRFVGEEAQIKIFLAQEVPQAGSFVTAKRPVLKRFSSVVTTLGSLFGLPIASLHIFFDVSSQHIAFNREGSLFFNLRFYEAWHDADVNTGNKSEAYVFWYFTFAHEIAHNLVQDHNAEHEFYFSATSQKYIMELFKLV